MLEYHYDKYHAEFEIQSEHINSKLKWANDSCV